MKYYIFFILLFFNINWSLAQNQEGMMRLLSSKHAWIIDQNQSRTIKGVYEQKGNTLSADSSILLRDTINREFFDAFKNVVITQQSGTVIYADRLHYEASSQVAILTGNVRLVSSNSVLTTNHLTYNLRSKTGTYTGGGRIISQTDTITSQRAYYFEKQGDAYFRGKVVVRTPQVKVYTDSMNYNQITKDTYFFGPTDIKGINKENLYTERGVYNTETGIAKFSKKNLYNEGSKFLSGDSLYYEKAIGVGEAFRNVVFVDTLDKFHAYGGKGIYKQSEESIMMTEKPYIVMVVQNDSTSTDSTKTTGIEQNTELKGQKKTNKKKTEEVIIVDEINSSDSTSQDSIPNQVIIIPEEKSKVDSVYMTADTLFSKVIFVKDYKPLDLKLNRDGGAIEEDTDVDYGEDDEENEIIISGDSTKIEMLTDSIPTKLEQDSVKKVDSKKEIDLKNTVTKPTQKKKVIFDPKKDPQSIQNTLKADSILRKNTILPTVNQRDSLLNNALKTAQTADTVKTLKDTTAAGIDTARTRILNAYYNVRLFKSDLQAVADSVYYGMQDSMFRFMGRPMIWAQGSQISADTIYMQILNQKMDNALLKNNAFMINTVLDTVKFNQVKGRRITAFFKNNSIERLFVDGNAETLVFSSKEGTNIITEMLHDRSGRIKIFMENNELTDYFSIRKVDRKVYPFKLVSQDNEILPGFIWRPQDRPTSKEDLLNRKREVPKEEPPKDTKNKSDQKVTEPTDGKVTENNESDLEKESRPVKSKQKQSN